MTFASTHTTTYTVADIRKVVDNFAADFSMVAQATGLYSRDGVSRVVTDLKIFAEYGYITDVKLILTDARGITIRGATYDVSTSASGWASDRPGNNIWPRTPGGSLNVIASFTSGWWDKSDAEKESFQKATGLNSIWVRSSQDCSFSGLVATSGQRYASNLYGWERTNYT
jgi:hypothetical protein